MQRANHPISIIARFFALLLVTLLLVDLGVNHYIDNSHCLLEVL